MNILINCSNLKAGGGIQVADSLCRMLNRFPEHCFTVVLSDKLAYLEKDIKCHENISTVNYTMNNTVWRLLSGRDAFLDALVKENDIELVFFVFGPSVWIPRVRTAAGFAMGHLVLPDSPYWKILSLKDLIKMRLRNLLQKRSFARLADFYFTENPFISTKLQSLFPKKYITTVTNSCHQVFQQPERWDKSVELPLFNGLTMLTVAAPYPHKNLSYIPRVLDELERIAPDVKVRFVITASQDEFGDVAPAHKDKILFIGRVSIMQCPYLYQQSQAIFLPTMLECFSANYVEAMTMRRPILTSDLGFARSLCGEAALYFDPCNPRDGALRILEIIKDESLKKKLVQAGEKQLTIFDTSFLRAKKMVNLMETAATTRH